VDDSKNIIHISADGAGFFKGLHFQACLGRSGVAVDRREGDGTTPSGLFTLRRGFWREDRLVCPQTSLTMRSLRQYDGWCSAPEDGAYNRLVRLPYKARSESLWREDVLYDIVIVIGFNDDPPKPYRGSAIFMHLRSSEGGATEGCVALGLEDMLEVLAHCDDATAIFIESARQK